jgi:hypothetical protein
MYPARELDRLAAHKLTVQRRISRRRIDCATAAVRAAKPLAWIDRMVVLWRQLSPWMKLAAVPLGFLLKKSSAPRPVGALLRWLPVISGAVRGFQALRRR